MEEAKREQGYNPGLVLFRLLMCFEVVLCHFWEAGEDSVLLSPFAALREIAVPCFILTAFFLGGKSLARRSGSYALRRLRRLIWPQIGWSFIYFTVYAVSGAILGLKLLHGPMDLVWQLLLGHSPQLNASMWYQFVLILLTLLFLAVFALLPAGRAALLCYGLSAAALVLQYTGVNYAAFQALPFEARYPLGRILEMLPYAGAGLFLSRCGFPGALQRHRIPVILGGIAAGFFFLYVPLFPGAPGFGYQGLSYLLSVLCLFTAFLLLPLENLSGRKKRFIFAAGEYTLGIYCVHRLAATFLFHILKRIGIDGRGFLLCLLLYAVSYFVSYLMARLPWKWSRMLVK